MFEESRQILETGMLLASCALVEKYNSVLRSLRENQKQGCS